MIRFGSGFYNVHHTERFDNRVNLMNKNNNSNNTAITVTATASTSAISQSLFISCQVTFLDSTQHVFQIERHAKGRVLLGKIFDYLELVEKDYFGLQFTSLIESDHVDFGGIKKWLDPSKSIRKQMLCPPFRLYFRVKFYVTDPTKLVEEYTRYHFFLQLKQDLLEGRLTCSESIAVVLASYAVQSEYGDYCCVEHGDNYLKDFKFVPNQDESKFISKVMDLHKTRKGQLPSHAEYNFLEVAKTVDSYGIDLFSAKDDNGSSVSIGCYSRGVVVYRSDQQTIYQWSKIVKLTFKKKLFTICMNGANENVDVEVVRVYNMQNPEICKVLWKNCIEHHTFFRLLTPPTVPPKTFFSIGSRYHYSGRTEFQSMEEMKQRTRVERKFLRNPSRVLSVNDPCSSSSVAAGHYYASVVAGASSNSNSHSFSNPRVWYRKLMRPRNRCFSIGNVASRRTFDPNSLDVSCAIAMKNARSGMLNDCEAAEPPKCNGIERNTGVLSGIVTGIERRHSITECCSSADSEKSLSDNLCVNEESNSCNFGKLSLNVSEWNMSNRKSKDSLPNGIVFYSVQNDKEANITRDDSQKQQSITATRSNLNHLTNGHMNTSQDHAHDVGCYFTSGHKVNRFVPTINGTSHRLQSPRSHRLQVNRSPRSSLTSHSSGNSVAVVGSASLHKKRSPCQSPNDEDNVVIVRMRADQEGRFGFNVKGGIDQNYPVIISKVAPGSVADKCNPKLNEGDQVLLINGMDVSLMSHDHVVRYIRSLKQANNGELTLTVRPNVYRCGDDVLDSDVIPESQHVADCVPRSDCLEQSLILLNDSLKSGRIISQFEILYRKKPGMSMEVCKQPSHINKNRYLDVYPYDETRVRICGFTGDYINASFINMEIPTSAIVNRYIAAQGPLASTCDDFWSMLWEQQCTTIIMLTTTVEGGRVKCHQYWPALYESFDYGNLMISCAEERVFPDCVYRELSIKDKNSREKRQVTQMQYTAWPDHGVPDDKEHFIGFVEEVRKNRAGSVDPIVVHCSAGIGRTGVLILMETAACLIEASEPVYPIEIVRVMRDQRAMLIQTVEQFKFVCECIRKAYSEKIIRPLPEYCKKF